MVQLSPMHKCEQQKRIEESYLITELPPREALQLRRIASSAYFAYQKRIFPTFGLLNESALKTLHKLGPSICSLYQYAFLPSYQDKMFFKPQNVDQTVFTNLVDEDFGLYDLEARKLTFIGCKDCSLQFDVYSKQIDYEIDNLPNGDSIAYWGKILG